MQGAVLFNDKPFHPKVLGFDVRLIDPIISDEGIGHDHNLSLIRGVGQNLLIACHARIKDKFTGLLSGKSERSSLKHSSVFKGKDGFLNRFHGSIVDVVASAFNADVQYPPINGGAQI